MALSDTCLHAFIDQDRGQNGGVDVGPFLNHTDVHRSGQHKHLRYVTNALSH